MAGNVSKFTQAANYKIQGGKKMVADAIACCPSGKKTITPFGKRKVKGRP